MPWNDPDPQDPSVLVGVELPGGREASVEMACVFAEEFTSMGWGPDRILDLFRNPFYAGAHRAWLALGEEEIVRIVDEASAFFGRVRVRILDAPQPHELLTIRNTAGE